MFAFYRYAYNIDIFCTMKDAVSIITRNELTYDQFALVKNLKMLLDFRSGYINIDGFTSDDVNNLIYTLSIDLCTDCNITSMCVICVYDTIILFYTFSV